jgi:hypothetical protein
MQFKKRVAIILSLALLICSVLSTGVLAGNTEDPNPIEVGIPTLINAPEPINAPLPIEESHDYFTSFGGIIQEITQQNDQTYLKTISDTGLEGYIVISSDTYVVGEIEVGVKVTGYYEKNAPMIMIYPPHYFVEAVVVESPLQNVVVDIFDEELVNSDYTLKLNVSEDTEIITQDGIAYEGSLANRKLVVFYDVTTRSIPAQTTPIKIVVLYDRIVKFYTGMPKEELESILGDLSLIETIVENQKIPAPAPYISEQGAIMVPVRAIAEALGYEVNWVAQTRTVLIGDNISFSIGQYYYYNQETVQRVTTSPSELTNGTTYVPLNFFKNVVETNNAYLFEGQIVVDNQEPME